MRIYVCSTMKAGTMFLHTLLEDLSQRLDFPHYSRNYGANSEFGLPKESNLTPEQLNRPGCFGPFRHYVPIPDPEKAQIILHFRDPRDVLTSMYFYLSYHQKHLPEGVRQTYIKRGLDHFVWNPRLPEASSWLQRTKTRLKSALRGDTAPAMAEWFMQDYRQYFDHYIGLKNTTVVTYETMVTGFPTWLDQFLVPFAADNPDQLKQALLDKYRDSFTPPPEDVPLEQIRHKRRIIPGDYKRQMSAETVHQLNVFFAEQLSYLGYEQ